MELDRPLATVTPTLDGDVLAVLARTDAVLTIGQLQRALRDGSNSGVRKVLRRLVAQGVVRSGLIGNAHTYQLNHEHLAAPAIIALVRHPDELRQRIKDRLAAWEWPPVYGAVVRGTITAGNDLDFVLVGSAIAHLESWRTPARELADDMTRWTGNDIRIVRFTVGEVASAGRDEPVLRAALTDGLTVAGTPGWLADALAAA